MPDNLFDRVVVAIGTQYLVDGEIGRGGSAVVYRGTDLKLGRQVAIKVLPPELAFNESVKTRFIREAQTAAGLTHPNIVPIYSVDEQDGIVYFVMALVVGQSVASHLATDHQWPADRTERVLREVADALAYAHSRGVVHRDVKPDNILIERASGRALVSDFGIARASEGESRLTLTGVAVGTPAYMSPEQALGERELDGRSDIYSLGVVGYHMLVGEQPFRATSAAAMLVKHVSETPARVRQKRPDVPPHLAVAIDRALAKRPEERWADASEFRDALAGAVVLPPQGYFVAERPPLESQPPAPLEELSRRELRRWNSEQKQSRSQTQSEVDQDHRRLIGAALNLRVRRRNRGRKYDDQPLIDRVLAFRGAVFRFLTLTPMFLFINATMGGHFPWFFFPSGALLFDALKKAGSIWSDGIGPIDAFKKGIRQKLLEAESDDPDGREDVAAMLPASAPGRQAPAKRPDRTAAATSDRALSTVAPDVVAGAYGAAVRRALDDSAVVREALNRLGPLERDMLPEVGPTVDALTDRVASLATTLHRLDMDVSGATLGTLDQRIEGVKGDADSPDRARRLVLLERQRTSLNDLLSRRQALVTQLESACLALQNLKLDLLKLRSAGVSAAIDNVTSPTQEARSVSRDIGRIIEVADDLRNI